jgi:hypothetical protein
MGEFVTQADSPLKFLVTLGPEPATDSYVEPINITGGVDSEIIDFRVIITLDDFNGRSIFSSRDIVSVTINGSSRRISIEATAPSEPGMYPLTIELLQENRLVHVVRAQLQVMPGAATGQS